MKSNYKVGYGKPPEHAKFKEGQSGNPKGRQKGIKNTLTLLREIAEQKINIQEGGKTVKITRKTAMLTQLLNQAIKGNTRAMGILIPYLIETDIKEEEKNELLLSFNEDDRVILKEALQKRGTNEPE